jgi:hypothetical protein
MRERGVSTVGAVILSSLAALLAAAALSDWIVVDVQTFGPDSVHVVVPMPLVVGHFAAAAVPDDAFEDAVMPPELTANREHILAALRSLVDAPDAVLVEVRADDAHVLVAKEGDVLSVAVDADDATVRCTVPLTGVVDALEDWDWRTVDPAMLFDILGDAPSGDLVRVDADDARVAVRIW